MSNFLTPEDASKKWLCPVSRTFGAKDLKQRCRGDDCALWRWKPRLASDPGYMAAILREAHVMANEWNEANKDQKPRSHMVFEKKAIAAVTRNPEGYGVHREEGYCGLGGPIT